MPLPNIDNATLPTTTPETTTPESKNESKALDLDIEDSFTVGTLLNKFLSPENKEGSDKTEKTQEETKAPENKESSQEPEKKPEEKIPDINVEEFLNNDPLLKRLNELKTLGYTEDQALEAVYGEKKEESSIESDYALPELKPEVLDLYEKVYKTLPTDQINYFVQARQQATDQHLIDFMKNYPGQLGLTKDQVAAITELPTYENDPIASASIRNNIKEKMQNFYGYHLNNISEITTYAHKRNEVTKQFQVKANTLLVENFPAMVNTTNDPNMAAKHEGVYQTFVGFLNSKMSLLDAKSQDDPVKAFKVFEASVKEFKKIYPSVLIKLKMQQEKPGLTPEQKQQEAKQLENLTTGSKTGIDNAKTYTIKDWDNPNELGNILSKLLDKKE